MKRAVVGILAHVDAGKTTLNEALLYLAGAVRDLGSVDRKSSHLDFHALEQQRGITIYSKQTVIARGDVELTLLDTPGHVDFSAEAERTLGVLDYAILVVDANSGVRGHAETIWRLLERYDVPTFVFVNKMDLAHRTRDEILAATPEGVVPYQDDKGCDRSALGRPTPSCEDWALRDEAALDELLATGGLGLDTMRRLVTERKVFPCFFGAALRQEGVEELLDGVAELVAEREWPAEFGAQVYKVSHDPQGARLTWMKVTGGSLEVKQLVDGEKVDQIRMYSGSKYQTVSRVEAGQVCAVTGLKNAKLDNAAPVLVPVMASSVLLNGNDVHKVHAALNLLTEEDPLLDVRWDERLQELQVQLMGTIQLEVLQATLAERFGFDVQFGPSGVLYRETIAAPVVGIGHFEPLRHYAEVHLLLEPLPAGSGVRFGTCCHVDDLDLNWQRLILTNAMERDHAGVLTGAPITDMRITLLGGRAHDKHTEGGDFRQATYRAIRQGLMQATSVLLEPWYRFSLRVPAGQVGRAMADLQRMSARSGAPLTEGDSAVLEGEAPASEMRDYAVQLAAYTHGMGSRTLEFAGYEPCHNADAVVAEAAYDPESDLVNTPDSVFCSHGAGHTVKWNEVASAAHVNPSRRTDWLPADDDFFGKRV